MGFFAKILGLTPKRLPIRVDDESFEKEVRSSSLPVIVDVWGPNCHACKQLEPVIMQLAAEYDGRVKVCEMSVLLAPRTAALLRIKGTPTVLYFQRGREVERVVGMRGSLYHEQTIAEVFGIAKEPARDSG